MTTRRAEWLAWALLLATALALRLVALGERPVHHDESQHGYFSWLLLQTGDYSYRPVLHGPVDFFSIAASFAIFGDNEYALRLPHALCGAALCLVPLLLHRELGRLGAFTTGVMLCLSPSMLYYSRFAREDIIVVLLTAIALVAVIRLAHAPRPRHAVVLMAALALSFAAKESTFITCFALVVAIAGIALVQRRGGTRLRDAWAIGSARALGRAPWQYAVATFLLLITLLFSNGLTNPAGLVTGVADGLTYWLGQHEVGRGGQPWTFYIVLLALYEGAVVVLAAAGAWLRRDEPFVQFLTLYALATLAVYSWAGEKFGWLMLHPLLPCALLAGVGVQAIWARRAAWPARLAAGAAAVLFGVSVLGATRASFDRAAADPREIFISPQTSVASADAVIALRDRDRPSAPLLFAVDSTIQWPWTWYLRGRHVVYVGGLNARAAAAANVAILMDPAAAALTPALAAHRRRVFGFRLWWVVDYGRARPLSVARWMGVRRPWSPTGGDRVWIYDRRVSPRD
jgi:uncharacterized protein (TIGR03663 family)